MRRKLRSNVLWGGVIGFCAGLLMFLLLPILIFWSPTFHWLADILGAVVEPLTELGIYIMCGSSPDIGCASGMGMLIFFLVFPLVFSIFWAMIGAVVGGVFAKL